MVGSQHIIAKLRAGANKPGKAADQQKGADHDVAIDRKGFLQRNHILELVPGNQRFSRSFFQYADHQNQGKQQRCPFRDCCAERNPGCPHIEHTGKVDIQQNIAAVHENLHGQQRLCVPQANQCAH